MLLVHYGTITVLSNVQKDRGDIMDKEIKFVFTIDDLEILNEALIQLPYYKVSELINKMNAQIENEGDNDETN